MVIHVPQSRLTERALLDALHLQLDAEGRVSVPARFELASSDGAEGARTGPNQVRESDRSVSGVANVESISRSGIRLSIAGLDVEHFNQCNPVVLACHESVAFGSLMPGAIGTIERVYKAQDATVLRFRNMKFDDDPIAEAWYQKVRKGIVRMVSVGFMPIEWSVEREKVGRGKEKKEVIYLAISQAELLEISVVPIGANRGALLGQVSAAAVLERVQAAEQRAAELLRSVETFFQTHQQQAATMARDRLLAAARPFTP